MSRVEKMTGIVGFVFVLGLGIDNALAACPTFPTGFTCKCNGDDTEWVCAKWSGPAPPVLDSDFSVTYVDDVPNISLQSANLGWNLYSEVISSGAAADIGTLTLDDSGADDYEVWIVKGAAAGAANVGTINLTDAGFTGYSSIEGGLIGGNLTGGLTLVQDSGGNGGELTLTIGGNVSGAMTIPVLKFLELGGDLSVKIDVTDEMNGTGFTSTGSVTTTGELEIADIVSGDIFFTKISETFGGTLDLENGIPSGTLVKFNSPLTSDGVLDFGNVGVAGVLRIVADNAADVINGGAVTSGAILAWGISGGAYSGSATFASVSSSGAIQVITFGDLEGSITVTGDMKGTIVVSGDVTTASGLIDVQGDLKGDIDIRGDVGADARVLVGGDASGDIEIGGDLSGSVTVDGDASGDIKTDGDQSGSVTVGGALANAGVGGGRILVFGETSGAIKVGKNTGTLTLIHFAGGLASGATLEINTAEGKFDAEGDIHVGWPGLTPLPPVTFDGCIRIYDDNGAPPAGGSLRGDLIVSGCHATNNDLNICVDGGDNGNISIDQDGCTNQVDWSCGTCP